MLESESESEFLVPEKSATIVLDEGPYDGARIEVSLDISADLLWDMRRINRELDDAKVGSQEQENQQRALFEFFVAHGLRGWNLRRVAGPVPATLEGMTSLPVVLGLEIVNTWMSAMAGRRDAKTDTDTD